MMCSENILLITGNIYRNAIHNLGQGVAILNTFLQNELGM